MKNQEKLSTDINEAFPSDEELIHLYSEIEAAVKDAVAKGMVIGNPILGKKDTRYGISRDALTIGSLVQPFLTEVVSQIQETEPSASCISKDDLHMTQGEVYFSDKGRVVQKQALITSQSLRQYYTAIRNNLSDFDPISLRLFRIILTLDPQLPGSDKCSMAVVAAFITDNNPQIHRLRQDIQRSVEQEGLQTQARLGIPKALFVSMTRLTQPPRTENGTIPLFQAINDANSHISPEAQLTIDKIYVRSTSVISYIMPKGYVTLDTPHPFKERSKIRYISKVHQAVTVSS